MNEFKKIYRIEVPGIDEAIDKVRKLNEELELQKAIKKEAQSIQIARRGDVDELQRQSKIIAASEISIKKLNAEKRIAQKEADLLIRTAEKEAKAQLDTSSSAKLAAGSYIQLNAERRRLLTLYQNTSPNDPLFEKIKADAIEAKRKVDEFNRSLSPDGTLVGEYRTGILNAFKDLGLDDIIKKQRVNIDNELKLLIERNRQLADEIRMAGERGAAGYDKIEKELIQNIDRIRQLENQQKEYNRVLSQTGTIGSQISSSISRGFKNIISTGLGVLGIAAGLQGVFSLISRSFNTTLKTDSLNNTLALVSKNERELTKNQQFLADETQRLGIELITATQAFNKFYAAATQAGLSADQAREVYLGAASAAANLKLSQEETNGVLLAFSQIASKGKVQAEELRGQIGERIPGAFSIAARAIGVTEEKLNKMLETGQVTAREFLPLFARELEKTFGVDRSKTIDSMQSSVNRFNNAVTELFTGDNNARKFFQTIVDGATNVIKFLSGAEKSSHDYGKEVLDLEGKTQSYQDTLGPLLQRYDELKGKTTLNQEEQTELKEVIQRISEIVPGAVTEFNLYGDALDINKEKVIGFAEAQDKLTETLRKTNAKKISEDVDRAIANNKRLTDQINSRFITETTTVSTGISGSSTTSTKMPLYGSDGLYTKRGQELATQREKEEKAAIAGITEILKLGGKLSDAQEKYLTDSNNFRIQQLRQVRDISIEIDKKEGEAFDAFSKGNEETRKKLSQEIKELRKQRALILDPTIVEPTKNTGTGSGTDAEKARREKERKEREEFQRKLRDIDTQATVEERDLLRARQAGIVLEEEDFEAFLFEIKRKANQKKLDLLTGNRSEEKAQRAKIQLDMINEEEEFNNKIFDIRKKRLDDELEAAKEQAQQISDKVLNDPRSTEREKANARLGLDNQLLAIQEMSNQKMSALEQEFNKQSEKNERDRAQAIRKIREDLNKDLIEAQQKVFQEQLDDINEQETAAIVAIARDLQKKVQEVLDDKTLRPETRIRKINDLKRNAELEALDNEIEADKKRLEIYREMLDQKSISQAEFDRLQEQLINKQLDREQKAADKSVEIEQRKKQILEAVYRNAFDVANSFLDATFARQQAAIDQENKLANEKLDLEEQQRLAQAQTQQERDEIDREFDAKRKAQEKEYGNRLKQQKLKELEILTGVAILQALASSPFPLNVINAGAVLIKALFEKARINAQQFAEGGKVFPDLNAGKINLMPNAPMTAKGDNVLAYVKPGEVVLNQKQQAMLGGPAIFRRIGVPGFADGGRVLGDSLSAPQDPQSFLRTPMTGQSEGMQELRAMVNVLTQNIQALTIQTNQRIDQLQVVQTTRSVRSAISKEVRIDDLTTL